MEKKTVLSQVDGARLQITLSRPDKRNALDEDVVAALESEAARAASDSQIRVVVLCGEGPVFCAGADIDWMKDLSTKSVEENRRSAERLGALFEIFDTLPKPLVGRVHGACLGGATGLAAACDIVVAARDCIFSLSEVRLGILPAVIAPYVTREVGLGRARELMVTGRRFDSEEARRIGLVHHVVDATHLAKKVDEVVADLLEGAPGAQSHVKEFLNELERRRISGAPLGAWTAEQLSRARASKEGRAGLAAFLERKRPPWAPPTRDIET